MDGQFLTAENQELLKLALQRDHLFAHDPRRLIPLLFQPCRVRVLLVTDGSLNYGIGGFGLRTFVETLLAGSTYYVRYEITLAHRRLRSGDQMMDPDPRIAGRITDFRFDDAASFGADLYEQVWLFGIETTPSIGETEVRKIAEFMEAGGGLFATGDHAALGKAMGGRIPRVRSMRLWEDTADGRVSMGGPRRNDTNRIGPGNTDWFEDQSDDIPQPITPKTYTRRVGIWEASYPHPLLCGAHGTIDVMPDHPHEGECIEPPDVDETLTLDGVAFVEYPPGTAGNPRPLPEVISTSNVPWGKRSGVKDFTVPQTFGGIAAYDGHLASVGRVVTDATWHHFVNINLIGQPGATPPRDQGFLASPTGAAHLENIKNYYRNIAVWLAPAERIRCMNRRILWRLIFHDRVIEALATHAEIRLAEAPLGLIFDIGKHARDVLGRSTSLCQDIRLALEILEDFVGAELIAWFDPWWPDRPPEPDPPPWFNLEPLLDVAFGGALVALRDEYGDIDPDEVDAIEESFDDVVRRGAEVAISEALRSGRAAADEFSALLRGAGYQEEQSTD